MRTTSAFDDLNTVTDFIGWSGALIWYSKLEAMVNVLKGVHEVSGSSDTLTTENQFRESLM